MKVEHINPFLNSVTSTFETMLSAEAIRGDLTLGDSKKRRFPISGLIGMSGNACGVVVINVSQQVALKIASTMLMEEQTEVNDDVLDAVGEIANIIAGQAKLELEQYDLSVTLPNVITGTDYEVRFPTKNPPVVVPFETTLGPICLEVGFTISEEAEEMAAV